MFPFDTQRLNIHVGGTFFNDTMALKFIPSARSTRWWSTHLQITSLEGEKESSLERARQRMRSADEISAS